MLKYFYLFLLLALTLVANDKIEVYATSMDSHQNIVNAYGDVTVIYKDYILSAKEAKYDRDTGELELFGNIRATHGDEYKLLGSYAKLNIQKKERTFRPFFMYDKSSKAWLTGGEGEAKDKDVDVASGLTSGCNPNDPLWKIEFTSSDYNTDSKWLNLYNARIYIYDIPVFYTPYFGYSLDTRRRTGLLTPGLGISDKEGVFYEQPLYIAEQNWWDLELKPQIRTRRGSGLYGTFRFVDSATSKGKVSVGYFKEKEQYLTEENLTNKTHYGYDVFYENTDVLNQWFGLNLSGQSGLYIDTSNMNDVDYINLSTNDNTKNTTSAQILSRANAFYNTDDNYLGFYITYYKDLTQENNRNTLQKLPTIQYHHYLDSYLKDHFFYNVDVHSKNIYRDINKKVLQTDIEVPLTLQTSVFDEYLNLAYQLNLYAQHSKFGGTIEAKTDGTSVEDNYQDGYYARNSNMLSASTQLARAYEDFTHVINFGVNYIFGGSEIKKGFYKYNSELNETQQTQEFYNISSVQEQLQFDFQQYFYDLSGEQTIYHRLSQIVTYNDERKNNFQELENELDYKISSSVSFYNNMFYNYKEHSISKAMDTLDVNYEGLNIALSHIFKHNFNTQTTKMEPFESFVTSSASYTYNEHYSYKARWDYDLQTKLKKGAEIGFLYKKRCWEFGLRYVENNRPILANGISSSVFDRYVYFTILLKPLMKPGATTSDFSLRMPDDLKGS